MNTYKFKKIDAFATITSLGNPAGYILLDGLGSITEEVMLQIAKEMKGFVNEVGYMAEIGPNEFHLRYYSSEREVDFCGHATVAIFYHLIKSNPAYVDVPTFTIHTNMGTLKVDNKVVAQDAVFILSPAPFIIDNAPTTDTIANALNIPTAHINDEMDIAIVNAGLNTLVVPISKLDEILGIDPDLDYLKAFCIQSDIDIIITFCPEVVHASSHYRTRVFAPTFGYLEDPATGSGNSALGYYLLERKMWHGNTLTIEQNSSRERFNIVKLLTERDSNNVERVCFGGGAITRIAGEYFTYN